MEGVFAGGGIDGIFCVVVRGGSDSSFWGGGSGATDFAFAEVGGTIAGIASVFCCARFGGRGGGNASADAATFRVLAGAAPRASGAGIARCVPWAAACGLSGAVLRDGRPGGGLRLLSFDGGGSFGNPEEVRPGPFSLVRADDGGPPDAADAAFALALAAFTTSGVTAGMRVVESIRVGGTESPSSAIE